MEHSHDDNLKPLTLGKSAKLRHRSLVEALFRSGKGGYEYPLRAKWRQLDSDALDATFKDHRPDRIGLVQILITVPKKKRRHAVDRVLVRRRIREAFRLRRRDFEKAVADLRPEIRTLSISMIYQATENIEFAKIDRAVSRILAKILRSLQTALQENSPE